MKARMVVSGIAALAAVFLLAPAAQADSWTLALAPPGGAISGPAGSTIGWGFTVTNQSATNWLMLTGITADLFQQATPDASIFSFPILAPMSTLSVAYNAATFEGIFQITWDATAPVGFTNLGVFIVTGEFWDADPFAGGGFVSLALDQSAAYSATVSPSANTPVPEPATLLLATTGAAVLLLRRRRSVAQPDSSLR
ncbi:MAG: PEP-CTERM sorting domain-containing protein [Candidatus Acidiferrales bacterium]